MVKVIPYEVQSETEGESLINETIPETSTGAAMFAYFKSIKFIIMALMSIVILITVFSLSSVWMGSLLPGSIQSSSLSRDEAFQNTIAFISNTLYSVSNTANMMKYQNMAILDFNSTSQKTNATYYGYQLNQRINYGLVNSLFLSDSASNVVGIYGMAGTPYYWLSRIGWAMYAPCNKNITQYCENIPGTIYGRGISFLGYNAYCNATPDGQATTTSVVDPNIGETYFTLVTCIPNDKYHTDPRGYLFHHFLGVTFTTGGISTFLKSGISIAGSTRFIIELSTNYVIVTDDPNTKAAYVYANKTVLRYGLGNMPTTRMNEIGNLVQSSLKNNLYSTPCNKLVNIDSDNDFISVYRLCTDFKSDWFFVMAVPKWNFIGSIVIGVVVSIGVSLLLTAIGIVSSVIVSLKIVKPFDNLSEQFKALACMDLENIDVKLSGLSEVNSLQKHFIVMIGMIKLYRSFIPSHLLAQLDNKQSDEPLEQPNGQLKEHKKHTEDNHSASGTFSEKQSSLGSRATMRASNKPNKNSHLFSLNLEKKKVTTVGLFIKGFSSFVSTTSSTNKCTQLLTDVFEVCNSVSKVSGGTIGTFYNDFIPISFNSTIQQSNHITKALLCGKLLLEKLAILQEKKWKTNSEFPETGLEIKVAVVSQNTVSGNIGTKDFKNFSIISSQLDNLKTLLKISNMLNVNFIVSEQVQKEIKQDFHTRLVAIETLLSESDMSFISVEAHHELTNLYEVGESTAGNADEWMYELEAKEKKEKWNKYNQACEFMFNNEYENAIALFKEYPTNDLPAQYMLNRCNKPNQ